MSLLAISLGIMFYASRKGDSGEVGRFQHWAEIAWLLLGLAVERPSLALGGLLLSLHDWT